MADWTKAPEVAEVASKLIGRHHGHLAEARIVYLFREGNWSSKDRTTWGMAQKVSDRDKFLTGYDFYLIINYDVWKALDQSTREALVDHELSHCGQNESGSWVIWGHDIEDFAAIVRRHGLWNESVKLYLAAAEGRDKDQMELFTDDGTGNEDDYSDLIEELEREKPDRTSWILNCSVGDVNYDCNIPKLTDDELIHCLKYEDRKSGQQKLKAEARRRGIQLPAEEVA